MLLFIMDNQKTIDKVIAYFGSSYKAANAIGVKHQQFYLWKRNGFIPFKRGKQIEELTEGKITATEIFIAAGNQK